MSYSFNLALPLVKESTSVSCRSPKDIAHFLADTAMLAQEAFTVVTVNTKYKVIDRHLITLGIVDSAPIAAREVYRPAIQDGAFAVILSHNHPSSDPNPSAEDLQVTRQLIQAGKLLHIPVLDHVIIGRGAQPFLSLRASGLVDFA